MRTKQLLPLALLVFLSVLFANTTSAQLIRYGLKGGLDVVSPKVSTDVSNVENRIGFRVGGVLELNIPLTGFGIESGVYYGNKGYDVKDSERGQTGSISNLNYLTVPVLLKQRFSILKIAGIYISGGVFGNYGLSGGELKIGEIKCSQKIFQTGLDFGAGVSLLNHLDAGVSYRYKFGDAYDYEGIDKNFQKVDRQTWTVSLGYLF